MTHPDRRRPSRTRAKRLRELPTPRWRNAGALLLGVATAVSTVGAQTPAGPTVSAVRPGRLPLAPLRTLAFTVDEGTLMSVDVSPDGTRLVFDLLGQLFTLPIAGGRAHQLTTGPAFAERPMFARDGRQLLFWSDRGGARALWRLPVSGGQPTPVQPADTAGVRLPAEGLAPDTLWAPGGRYGVRLPGVESTLRGTTSACLEAHLEIVERATGQSRRVARQPAECLAPAAEPTPRPSSAFTPDGRAFITSFGGQLRRVDLATGTVRVIPFTAQITLRTRPLVRFPHRISDDSLVHARHIEQPRISPNGRQVVFVAFDRLWRMALPRGPARRLTTLNRIETDPVWSPDGQFIAFAAWSDSGGGDGALYRVRPDGTSPPERLTRDVGGYRYSQLTYTADGQRLAAVRQPSAPVAVALSDRYEADPLELVWLPASGGAVTATPLPADVCQAVRGFPRRGLASFPNKRDAVQLITGSRVYAVALGSSAGGPLADTTATPLLVDLGARLDSLGGPDLVEASTSCPLLAPTRDRALVYRYRPNSDADLYLVEVSKPAAETRERTDRGPRLPAVRRIALPFVPPAGGPESPDWAPDGRSFTFSYGRTLYRYDLARADALLSDSVARVGPARVVRGPVYRPSAVVLDAALPRARPPRGTLVFRHARLIMMRGTKRGPEVIERGDLVVRDGRIAALGPSGTVAIPHGAQVHVIEAAGHTILPGLVDLHNHLTNKSRRERHIRYPFYEAALAFGVLTSRDPQALALDFLTLEDEQAAGLLLGPRVRDTGPGIGDPFHAALTSLAAGRAAVRPYVEVYGVEYLKEYELPRRDQRQWLVMAAAEQGLNVVSHGHGTSHLIQDAIDGYGGYDHRWYAWPLYADVRQLLARSGLTLAHHDLGTFGGWSLPVGYFRARLDSTGTRLFERWCTAQALAMRAGMEADSGAMAQHAAAHWEKDSVTAQLAAAGAHIAVASHGDEPGYATHMYLWALVQGGMPPLEALRSGTLRGAEALGLDRELGSLEVGKLAHLLVVNGNPLERIEQTMSLHAVLFNGRLYDPATLDELWPRPLTRGPGWWEPPAVAGRGATAP